MQQSAERTLVQLRQLLAGDLSIEFASGPALDAFGRQRVANPQTLFDGKLLAGKEPLFWAEKITDVSGNAAATHASAAVTLHVESGDTVIRQTKQHWNYQPGKSQQCTYTGIIGAQPANATARIGSFTDDDGVFFEATGDELFVVIRKGGSDTRIPQSAWNLDKLDGSKDNGNRSGITLDPTKEQIFGIDYQWLGTGAVRFSFDIGGRMREAHQAFHANMVTSPYMNTPNLPVRYEISSTGPTVEMVQVCSAVASEGGQAKVGPVFSAASASVTLTTGDTYALVGMKLQSGRLDAAVRSVAISGLATTVNDLFELFILLNPTVAGTFTYTDYQSSAVQVATGAATNTITGGTRIGDTSYGGNRTGAAESDVANALGLGSDIDGLVDEFVLCITPLSNGTFNGAMTWQELL